MIYMDFASIVDHSLAMHTKCLRLGVIELFFCFYQYLVMSFDSVFSNYCLVHMKLKVSLIRVFF